jgi:hypothetical protein
MVRLPLPFSDAVLLLTPRWADLSRPLQGLTLFLAVLPFLLVMLLCRYEMRLVGWRRALPLLGLRLTLIGLLLALILLQPVLARTVIEDLPGRVLIAVDRSASMDVADPQRPLPEKLRLAASLHLADDLADSERLNQWASRLDQAGTLSAEQLKVIEAVGQRVDSVTRTQTAHRLLAATGGNLLETIASKHDIELHGFSRDIWTGRRDHLDDFFEGAGLAVTDLSQPLAKALEAVNGNQGQVLGLVLLTDGQHNWGAPPSPRATELGERGVPIFPIAIGARRAPPDVAIVWAKAPATVFKDVDVPVDVRIKVSSLPAQNIPVTLRHDRPGRAPMIQEQTLRHDGKDGLHTLRFELRLEEPGVQTLLIAARPVAEETRTDNNSRPVVVNVADDTARVLLIDGEARWEYHYLASALARDRTIKPTGIVLTPPLFNAALTDAELTKMGHPRRTLLADSDAYDAFACVIVGDLAPDQLPPTERRRLERYVADQGGTLVVLAGQRFMPHAFLGADAERSDDAGALARLLPIESVSGLRSRDGFGVNLTTDGQQTSFLQMESTLERSLQRWSALPKHYWGAVARAKPGASILATPQGDRDEGDGRSRALIARHHYGFGRVLFVGLDSTWRWRFKVGDSWHHRFWGQVVRWAAADRPLVTGNDRIRFGPREPVVPQGQDVNIVARLEEGAVQPGQRLDLAVRVMRPGVDGKADETVALVPLAAGASRRILEGRIRDLPAGVYRMDLTTPDPATAQRLLGPEAERAKLRSAFTVTPPDSGESVQLETNEVLLEELASKSGGHVFTPDDVSGLMDRLTRRTLTYADRAERRLWQDWWTLYLFLALVTAEWLGRKLAGLP